VKANHQAATLALHGRDSQPLANRFEDGVVQKVFQRSRQFTKAVSQFTRHIVALVFGTNRRNTLVGAQTKIFGRDIFLRDAQVEAEIERGAKVGRGFFTFEFADGALEHLRVHIEADRFDVAVLLAAEEISSAAEFEVESGDSKAGAEFAEFFHRGESLAGDFAESGLRRNEKISVGALIRTADAATKLIKFGQAEAIGAVDEDGVSAGNVEAIFDDRGCDEDIGFVANKFEHDGFELFFGDLAVANDDARRSGAPGAEKRIARTRGTGLNW